MIEACSGSCTGEAGLFPQVWFYHSDAVYKAHRLRMNDRLFAHGFKLKGNEECIGLQKHMVVAAQSVKIVGSSERVDVNANNALSHNFM